jgi:cytochrome c oxidase assembly factor CtaG
MGSMSGHPVTADVWGILLTLCAVCAAFAYLLGWWRLHRSELKIPFWRAASFLGGGLLVWVALASPVSALDHELLTFHMIQHLLLMTLAPPLIWLGEPVMVFWFAWSSRRPKLSDTHEPALLKALTHPAVGLFFSSAVLVLWHIPSLFALGMQSTAWHAFQEFTFLAAGLLFWWPVIQPWPSVHRHDLSLILYLFLATVPCDVLSGFLVFCDRVVYPTYLSSTRLFGLSALGDQQCAAALMWTCVTIVYLMAGALLTTRLLSPQGAAQSVHSACVGSAGPKLIQRQKEAL